MGDEQADKIELVNHPTGAEIDLSENKGYTASPMGEIQTIPTPPEDFWTSIQASTVQPITDQSPQSED